jgi:hypothetical protein
LKKAWDLVGPELGEGEKKPSDEEGLLRGLARHLLGEAHPVASVLEARHPKKAMEVPSPLDPAWLEDMEDFFEDREFDEVRALVTKAAAPRKPQPAAAAAAPGPAEEAPARQRFKMQPGPNGEFSAAAVKSVCPKVSHFSVSRETQWRHRWRAKFSGYAAPNSFRLATAGG